MDRKTETTPVTHAGELAYQAPRFERAGDLTRVAADDAKTTLSAPTKVR